MKVLIFGGSGMLGHKLLQVLADDFEVFATVRRSSDAYDKLPLLDSTHVIYGVSVQDPVSVARALDDVQSDVVVNCIGIVKQLKAARDPLASIWINALFPHQLARLCCERDVRLIHISTDCVFSGRKGNYSEKDFADADDLYGRTKFLGEVVDEGGLTIRTSMIGRELQTSNGLVEWFLSQTGKKVRGYRRTVFSGFTTNALAKILGGVIGDHPELNGVWHVASEPINKLDLLSLIRDIYGLDIEIEQDETVVCNRSLNGDRFRAATGFVSPSWPDMIVGMQHDATPYDEIRRRDAH